MSVRSSDLHILTFLPLVCLHLVSFTAFALPCSACSQRDLSRDETASKEQRYQLGSSIFEEIQDDMWADRLWDWSGTLAQANDPCKLGAFSWAWVIEMCNNCDRGHYLTHFPFLLTLLCLYMPSCHNPLQISKVKAPLKKLPLMAWSPEWRSSF